LGKALRRSSWTLVRALAGKALIKLCCWKIRQSSSVTNAAVEQAGQTSLSFGEDTEPVVTILVKGLTVGFLIYLTAD